MSIYIKKKFRYSQIKLYQTDPTKVYLYLYQSIYQSILVFPTKIRKDENFGKICRKHTEIIAGYL